MNINSRRSLFRRRPQSNIYRMFLWVVMILGGVWMLQQMNKGEIKPLFLPTPLPTRAVASYLEEGDAHFTAGNLTNAILAYQEALRMNPNDAQTWAKLARIQTYSSAFLITNDEKEARLREALESATKAVELAPEDSTVRAIRAFTLDWNANSNFHTAEEVQDFLIEAENEALIAQQLDNTNPLALAYFAEILVDQQKWNQAEIIINQALELPDASQPLAAWLRSQSCVESVEVPSMTVRTEPAIREIIFRLSPGHDGVVRHNEYVAEKPLGKPLSPYKSLCGLSAMVRQGYLAMGDGSQTVLHERLHKKGRVGVVGAVIEAFEVAVPFLIQDPQQLQSLVEISREPVAIAGIHPPLDPGPVNLDAEERSSIHGGGKGLRATHAAKPTAYHQPSGEGSPEVLPGAFGKGLVGTLENPLGADVDPRARRHLAEHGETQGLEPAELLPGSPARDQVGVGDQYSRRFLVGAEYADRLAGLHEQGLVPGQTAQGPDDCVERLPAPRRLPGPAVDDELVGLLRDLGVQVQ